MGVVLEKGHMHVCKNEDYYSVFILPAEWLVDCKVAKEINTSKTLVG